MQKYTAIAVTVIDGDARHWHNKAEGSLEIEGQEALWNGSRFQFLGTGFGLERTCVAVILKAGRFGYKVYTDTPAHGATVSDVLLNLEKVRSPYVHPACRHIGGM